MMKNKTKKAQGKKMETAMAPLEYLKKPYGRFVVPDSDGTFRAEIIEFPGCIAVGDTAAEALANLENVAVSWLEATLAKGQRVPEPMESVAFSGKLVVRLPKSLHKKAAHMAARDGVSLNQFIVSSIGESVGGRVTGAMIGLQPVPVIQGALNFSVSYLPIPHHGTFAGVGEQALVTPPSGTQVAAIPIGRAWERANAGD